MSRQNPPLDCEPAYLKSDCEKTQAPMSQRDYYLMHAAINQAAKNFAEVVLMNCPSGADRSAAIRLIRDARMTANAAIALNGLSLTTY